MERWADIPGYEGLYEVSDHGRIKSFGRKVRHPYGRPPRSPVILCPTVTSKGYCKVTLCKDNVRKTVHVHVLVAEAFIGPRPEGLLVRHRDDKGGNNHYSNLVYGTGVQNKQDQVRNGNAQVGSNHPMSKLTDADIPKIREHLACGHKPAFVARLFNVSREAISDIKNGRSWVHV